MTIQPRYIKLHKTSLHLGYIDILKGQDQPPLNKPLIIAYYLEGIKAEVEFMGKGSSYE